MDHYGNGLRQNRINPVMVEGEVVISAFVDPISIQQRKRNAENNALARGKVYSGGQNDNNLHVARGEIVLGLRERDAHFYAPSDLPQVYGYTTANGLEYESYGCHDAIERDHVFLGVSKTPFRVNDPEQPQHGFAVYAGGKITAASNNDGTPKYAGDELEWAFPPTELTPDGRVPGARAGAPLGKQLFQFKRVEYTDYQVYLAGFTASLEMPRDNTNKYGINGIKLAELFDTYGAHNNLRNLSNAQEQNAKLKFGLTTMILRAIEFLVDDENSMLVGDEGLNGAQVALALANQLGLFADDANQALLEQLFVHTMWPELPRGYPGRSNAENKFNGDHPAIARGIDVRSNSPEAQYAHAALHCASFSAQGFNLMADHRRSKRVGKCLAGTPAFEQMDVLLNH